MEWLEAHLGLVTFGLALLMPLGGIIFRAQVHAMIQGKANSAEVTALAEQIGQQDQRLGKIEMSITHLPTKDQMHSLHMLLAGISGDVKVATARIEDMDASIGGLTRRVELIDEHLKRAAV